MDDEYTFIDPKLKPYVDTFIHEANTRGIKIDTYGLKIAFGDLKGEAAGRTYHRHKRIIIDTVTAWYWRHEWGRESLVSHELGHLYLHREHDGIMYGTFQKSIMNSASYTVFDKEKLADRRKYYFDELFNPSTERPKWTY